MHLIKENQRENRLQRWCNCPIQGQGTKNATRMQRSVSPVQAQNERAWLKKKRVEHLAQWLRDAHTQKRGGGGTDQEGNRRNRTRLKHGDCQS